MPTFITLQYRGSLSFSYASPPLTAERGDDFFRLRVIRPMRSGSKRMWHFFAVRPHARDVLGVFVDQEGLIVLRKHFVLDEIAQKRAQRNDARYAGFIEKELLGARGNHRLALQRANHARFGGVPAHLQPGDARSVRMRLASRLERR